MNEFTAILKARRFIKDSGIDQVPVNIELYAEAINAKIDVREDMDDQESGQTFPLGEKHIITVNGMQREERQRFTVLHEIAHIVLELPSQHSNVNMTTTDLISYKRRPAEEILCDVFAAECLLPYDFFKKDVDSFDISLDAIKQLAEKYEASVTSTGSRFAVNYEAPCAFVLIESGRIRYVSRSKFLRELNGWIEIGGLIPQNSVVSQLIQNHSDNERYDEIPTDIWFANKIKNYELLSEEAKLLKEWDQCFSIIWFEESSDSPGHASGYDSEEEEPLLRELDGTLPWPSKSRRK